jgi:cell shape-determining protein MreD
LFPALRFCIGLIAGSCPVLLTLAWIMFGALPFGVPGQALVQGAVAMILVFVWSHTPRHGLTPLAAFGTGIAADLLNAAPFGVSPFVFVLLQAFGAAPLRGAARWRDPSQPWSRFAVAALLCALLQWGLVCALNGHFYPLRPPVLLAVLAMVLYSPVAAVVMVADRAIPTWEA